ncbi:MAG: GTP-binding protein [Lachnospiraceae bacterium]|nr:GTP-binding protein [Lachnospiraceae bacterium]
MKKLAIGILAHVDAGKTTLSESMLYESGSIRRIGRVDNGDTFLDTYDMEKKRGITIFSKQAMFGLTNADVTLLDTPGHVDFSAEMERTLQVLDYAILIISGADGVQGHTETLWYLLQKYKIPTFLFVNKMDQPGTDPAVLLKQIKKKLSVNVVDFSHEDETFYENIAVNKEELLTEYLENGEVDIEEICALIKERAVFPCYFGSALKNKGVREFMDGLDTYTRENIYGEEFGARVFKITRDPQGNRLTHLKLTGGKLQVKDVLHYSKMEKVNQIRLYSGEKYESVKEVCAGQICAVTGLTETFAGQGFGVEQDAILPFLEPVLTYEIIVPEEINKVTLLPKLMHLMEEEPVLHIRYQEETKEIFVRVMGDIQLEVLKNLILERCSVEVTFGSGSIVYKETIADTVEGVGHFEPLRHYAEVHVLLQPGKEGSGLEIDSICSEDLLAKNWQRLILTHLEEKKHLGVLTGAPITDMRITLVSGRAHQKHTEGGDFRQATYRAVRQGLRQAKSVLLEPYYRFRLELPTELIGRAMADVDTMHGACEVTESDEERSVLTGTAPVSKMNGYQREVTAYSRGKGVLSCTPMGYKPCHNTEEVVARIGYNAEADVENPTGSVFCAHGAGFLVEWQDVPKYMHIPYLMSDLTEYTQDGVAMLTPAQSRNYALGTDEIDAILSRTSFANSKEGYTAHKRLGQQQASVRRAPQPAREYVYKPLPKKDAYLLVDGYNVIFAWDELKELAAVNIDAARDKLADLLCNYQGLRQCNLILVFDAYRVKGHAAEMFDYHNIHIVYTKEAQTADAYIEKFAHEYGKKYDITVATSDRLEQIIIIGAGCKRLSSQDLQAELENTEREIEQMQEEIAQNDKNYLFHAANTGVDNLKSLLYNSLDSDDEEK